MLNNTDKAIALYTFLKKFSELKFNTVTDIADYEWIYEYNKIPDYTDDIEIFFRDKFKNDEEFNPILMKVHKPNFIVCPKPDDIFVKWLYPGWNEYENKVEVRDELKYSSEEKDSERLDEYTEFFSDVAERVSAYKQWIEKRKQWVENQKKIKMMRDFFTQIYVQHSRLQSESETLELVVATGVIQDEFDDKINHPVLLRKIRSRFDAENNTFYLEDIDTDTELYEEMFQEMEDINLECISELEQELHINDYHPLDNIDTPIYLKGLIHRLSSDSAFEDELSELKGKPCRLTMRMNPILIVRRRKDGTVKTIERIIENIKKTDYVPQYLTDIVGGGYADIPNDTNEETIEARLAAVGGEDIDILLSKEANKEQLEIARRIEKYSAVLVQGPPGTGKTHTIANLMGHFLAQGKSVLVTSYTKKALRVLKDKIVPQLQNLCVSVLDDSNSDMERSIDGITEVISCYNSEELKKEMLLSGRKREKIISNLADLRRQIYNLLYQENNNIIINGESISPSKAAAFVHENAERLSYIPGEVKLYEPIPVSTEELTRLYHSNIDITVEDEKELEIGLPNECEIIPADKMKEIWDLQENAQKSIERIEKDSGDFIKYDRNDCAVYINGNNKYIVEVKKKEAIILLKDYINSFDNIQDWALYAIRDGRRGGVYKDKWMMLASQIEKTCRQFEKIVQEEFGKEIFIPDTISNSEIKEGIDTLNNILAQKGKITGLSLIFRKSAKNIYDSIKINGLNISSKEDCDMILQHIMVKEYRAECGRCWDDLMPEDCVPRFWDLDKDEPERIAQKYIPFIVRYVDWYDCKFAKLKELSLEAGIQPAELFETDVLDSDLEEINKILDVLKNKLPVIIEVFLTGIYIQEYDYIIKEYLCLLGNGKRANSKRCVSVSEAVCHRDIRKYREAVAELYGLIEKYPIKEDRYIVLGKIRFAAPGWADAIQNREGIHGQYNVPETITQAWKWKQYEGIVRNITEYSYDQLQKKSRILSREYRKITAEYAEKSAWYHLLCSTEHDLDVRQALHGWKQAVRKIGKGTGKNAPKYRAEARRCMAKCQEAVPAWIMTVNKAMEILDPAKNKFDIIIIDEASQSDISSLAVLYMAKKAIIVGDDKQVSPMPIGIDTYKIDALSDMYIKNLVKNDFLYTSGTSLYDIAGTTFQPLMLREHFRCVPDIIGFSNKLSYDFKIKPLRDSGDCILKTAVIDYKVHNGMRHPTKKINQREAETIVSLIKSCIKQPEYDGKTFGVISLLGDEQVKLIQKLLFDHLEPMEMEKRHLLCGNASNFQGDERDIIFLSMVDSRGDSGPLRMMSYGSQDSVKKRYNVAVSRAKDQLWIVNSLDAANDLKSGDIRRELLEYADNPRAFDIIASKIEEESESPFEEEVAKYLVTHGYHLVQQWKVGSYRIDMVAICGNKKVAIECDGEMYHSGEDKIREDMERQTVLERLGWNFIRIRGSEYYRNPEKTMNEVVKELNDRKIKPEKYDSYKNEIYVENNDAVLERTKIYAEKIKKELFYNSIDYGERQQVITDILAE